MRSFKTENDFNAFITSSIKKMGTHIKALKTSDRFKAGVSDFLIFKDGRCVAVEVKYVKKIPTKGNVLKHVVSGPQLTFMTSMGLAGIRTYIILGVEEFGGMAIFDPSYFKSGNMAAKDFKTYVDEYPTHHRSFFFSDMSGVVDYLFGGYSERREN